MPIAMPWRSRCQPCDTRFVPCFQCAVIRLFHAYVEDLGVQPTIALLRLVVEAWEGIGDEEKADEFRVLQRTYERLQAPDL